MSAISPEDQERIDAIEKALNKRWPENKIEPSLERIDALVDALGSPQLTYPTIHIGGTNGKTSTARMIDSLLFEMGLRTGRFTSPHLESFLERITINGQPIDAKAFIFSYNDIAAYLDFIDSKFDVPISYFEAMTALAFAAFAEHPIDVGVIEVGMGGEWDATNVVKADVSVIMPVDLDHQEYLGETIAEIAATKAGIIKEGGFVVLAEQKPEAAVELLKKAATLGVEIAREGIEYEIESRTLAVGGQLLTIRTPKDRYEDIFLPLHGKHQASNAAAALVAVEAFFGDQELDPEAVMAGFAAAQSPGRCEILHRDPTVIIDAAHNPHGAKALRQTIENEFAFDEVIGIFAALGDKDVEAALIELEKVMNSIIVTVNSSPRSLKLAEIEKIALRVFGADRVFTADTLEEAIDKAIKDSVRPLGDDSVGILITGSVVTVGQARALVRRRFAGNK
ncbi:MAG: dihydrofolate synthase [Actinobacteria bacterium]|uniref:Unannotated protein n=1 Tax=freshwater metagenome TaxID=449393 RepID=A0A6J6CG55_9ZZZZ|nr:dihydrofolate synthase [Actinomycetota bacterium]